MEESEKNSKESEQNGRTAERDHKLVFRRGRIKKMIETEKKEIRVVWMQDKAEQTERAESNARNVFQLARQMGMRSTREERKYGSGDRRKSS